MEEYLKGERRLYGCEEGGELIGLIGVAADGEGDAEIRHLVVAREQRGGGIGRWMIDALLEELNLERVVAETDGERVGFYRGCGSAIESLGEKYPGVERFWCVRE